MQSQMSANSMFWWQCLDASVSIDACNVMTLYVYPQQRVQVNRIPL